MAAAAWAAAGTVVSVVGSLWGGNKAAKAAAKQAQLANEATERRFLYDTALYDMNKDRIIASREEAIVAIETRAKNEGKIAGWKDATNLRQYNHNMQIRNREQESLNMQYLRSNDIYHTQIDLNDVAEKQAIDSELRKYQEIKTEAVFDVQEQRLERLQAEGKFRAKGISGRSARKAHQINGAELGRMIAQVNEATSAAGRNTRAVLAEIAQDKISADLSAFAQKMLDPGVLPEPIKPFATPTAEFLLPREIEDYDFGPAPVLGGMYSPSAASSQVWGQTISGIAGQVGSAATAWATKG